MLAFIEFDEGEVARALGLRQSHSEARSHGSSRWVSETVSTSSLERIPEGLAAVALSAIELLIQDPDGRRSAQGLGLADQ